MSTNSLVNEVTEVVGEHPYARGFSTQQRAALSTLGDVISAHMAASPAGMVDATCGILHANPEDLRDALRPILGVLDAVCARQARTSS